MLTVVITGSDNYLAPTLCAFPRRCPQFADLGEVLTLLQLSLMYAASNKGPAVSIDAVSEVLASDANPLATSVRQLSVVHVTPFLNAVPLTAVHMYRSATGALSC